jgi:hypothetical protein
MTLTETIFMAFRWLLSAVNVDRSRAPAGQVSLRLMPDRTSITYQSRQICSHWSPRALQKDIVKWPTAN